MPPNRGTLRRPLLSKLLERVPVLPVNTSDVHHGNSSSSSKRSCRWGWWWWRLLIITSLVLLAIMSISMGSLLPRVRVPDFLRMRKPPPGSVYSSPDVFRKLWPSMQLQNDSSLIHTVWKHTKPGEGWVPCLERRGTPEVLPPSNGYILIEANGGLNQQRLSICDAVAVASLLNATLVIPGFHLNSVWQDHSTFGEIYDEEHFINTLARDVRVVPNLPDQVMQSFAYNMSNIPKVSVKALATPLFYTEKVLPKLLHYGAIRMAPFAKRLSYDHTSTALQSLKCFANYEALRFAKPIDETANLLVERMKERSFASDGKYVAVHLRYEKDIVAFSCCIYDGGEEEKKEMDIARENGWRGKFKRKEGFIRPGENRIDGQCPLTPLEVGMMLRGMGFTNSTPIYIASGDIYKEEKNMLPLKQMFPGLQTKDTLLTPEELAPFKDHQSRLAALDYTVCLHSEVFVVTQGSNFVHFLLGHRRFLNNGHAKTIKPDKRKLVQLLDNPKISWESFSKHLHVMRKHNDVKGHEMRKSAASIYTFPAPDCMCHQQHQP